MKTFLVCLLACTFAQAARFTYRYDSAGRLTTVNYDGESRTAYGYDKNGGLVSRVDSVTPDSAPPPHLAGVYHGLVSHVTPAAANSGIITLKLLANGSFSGKFTVGGASVAFKGVFAADGSAAPIVLNGKPPFTGLTLALDLLAAAPRITGTLAADGFDSDVLAGQALFNPKTNPLPAGWIGKYTALFAPTEAGAGIPQGDGYGLLTVKNTGGLTLAGRLADNTAFTHGSLIVGDGNWPLFVLLHKKAGLLSSQVTFVTAPGISDFAGAASWQKPETAGTFQTDAFTTELNFFGARYTPPTAGQRVLALAEGSGNLRFAASGGGLDEDPYERLITLDAKNKLLVPADASALKLGLVSASGLFTGSFKDNGMVRPVAGVLLQSLNRGAGFIAGGSESGAVELVPQP
jgi:YD repeat-containing protein